MKYKIVEIKCVVPANAGEPETSRRELFEACQDLSLSVLESNTRPMTKDEKIEAKNIGIID